HAHAVGHAAPAHFGVSVRVLVSVPPGSDIAEPLPQLRDPVLEPSALLRAHLPGCRAVFVGRIRHDTHVLRRGLAPGAIERGRTLRRPPRGVKKSGGTASPRYALGGALLRDATIGPAPPRAPAGSPVPRQSQRTPPAATMRTLSCGTSRCAISVPPS